MKKNTLIICFMILLCKDKIQTSDEKKTFDFSRSNNYISSSDFKRVKVETYLNLRKEPSIKSKAITQLFNGTVVYMFKDNEVNDKINGIQGNWNKVRKGKFEGWVFGQYLHDLPKNISDEGLIASSFRSTEASHVADTTEYILKLENEEECLYSESVDYFYSFDKEEFRGTCLFFDNEITFKSYKLHGEYKEKEFENQIKPVEIVDKEFELNIKLIFYQEYDGYLSTEIIDLMKKNKIVKENLTSSYETKYDIIIVFPDDRDTNGIYHRTLKVNPFR
ncbi:SH3 domain-containing protein [Leptospira sp. GIMC2001]|uniref:SH3 domain-containing protein n=1 Tax=Leptospira sp. GIMC2001 TaxID=1513297 RepID=UPI00234A494C|nr:SH3 domain-containing protein [Leptospira sp. GIMC2001]WCL51040.1 SH3 domain-containing protein [Leptospira sp. GIMC2001]